MRKKKLIKIGRIVYRKFGFLGKPSSNSKFKKGDIRLSHKLGNIGLWDEYWRTATKIEKDSL